MAGVACQIEEAFVTGLIDRIKTIIFAYPALMGRIHCSYDFSDEFSSWCISLALIELESRMNSLHSTSTQRAKFNQYLLLIEVATALVGACAVICH